MYISHKNNEDKIAKSSLAMKIALAAISFLIVTFFFTSAFADDLVYKSATEYDYPPFSVTNEGVADGFSVDLLKAVAKEMGINITFKIDDWSTIKKELEDGDLDVLPLVGYNEERDKVFDFTAPYIIMHGNIFVREGSDISSEEDLFGKEIIVMRGDNMHEFALEKNYTDKLILTDTYKEAFELLSSGKYDAVLSQNLVGQMLIEELGIKKVYPVTTIDESSHAIRTKLEGFEQKFCFAVKAGDSELLAKLNEGLALVSANGTYNDLYYKWFPFEKAANLTFWDKLKSSLTIIVPLVIIILGVSVIITRRQIANKKYELEKSNNTLLMLEGHLIQKQKLESIGTLASGVAHEINNPINGILNYSQIISDMACSDPQDYLSSCENIKEYSNEIIQEAHRISTIVSNLLQFSRTEKNSFSRADVRTLIDGVLSLVNIEIKRSDINLSVNVDDDIKPINCRTQQIQQILINLITNGKDALNEKYPQFDDNKKMIISAKNLIIDKKDFVRLSVEDHGNGISANVAKNIFDPFFTTKSRTEGTGLGLSISYNIAQDHNGNLSFETQEGEFTKFYLDIPAEENDESDN